MGKKILINVRRKIIAAKIMINRSLGYVSLVNAGMVLFLTLTKLRELGYINFDLSDNFFFIYFGGVAVLIIMGYVEIRLVKGLSEESRRNFEQNPMFMDMKKKLDELYEISRQSKSKRNS